jgi:F-type H+-transporting ATPase subunit gamma
MASMASLRTISSLGARRAAVVSPRTVGSQVTTLQSRRNMATEKQLSNKIQSTKNIKKITSSMKMVAAARLKGEERRLQASIPFNKWTYSIYTEPKLLENSTFNEFPSKVLIVPFTSDKGLCGGINSFISRGVRDMISKLDTQSKKADVCVIGEKGRAQMARMLNNNLITRTCTDVVAPGNYALASALSTELIKAGAETDYDAVIMVYNSYKNAAVYNQMYKIITPLKSGGEEVEGGSASSSDGSSSEALAGYDFDTEKAESMTDLYEFILSTNLYHSFMDGAAAEQSARMTAMEGASSNAGEMIDKLTLQYNRARQARITTELIEIISGASALEKKK